MNWIEEIHHEIGKINHSRNEVQKFGFLFSAIFLILFLFSWQKEWFSLSLNILLLSAGLLFFIFSIFAPLKLKIFHLYWMTFAIVLGSIVSRIILFVLFFVIVTPISIFANVIGKKFFLSYNERNRQSFWRKRDSSKKINYERMS